MNSPFDSTKELVWWADQHLKWLKGSVDEFDKSKPYTIVADYDHGSGDYVHKVKLNRIIPPQISLHTFDAINALRASLDHVIYASAFTMLGRDPKGTKFPFGRDEKSAREDAFRKGGETDPEIINLALSFKPYDTGDRLLRNLNTLRNMKHHRVLAAVAVADNSISVSNGTIRGSLSFSPTVWDPERGELTLYRSSTPERNYDLRVSVRLAFGPETPFAGSDAVAVLDRLVVECQRIGMAIEAKTAELVADRNHAERPE